VWVLHRWSRHDEQITVHPDKESAIIELASYVNQSWDNLDDADVRHHPPTDAREMVERYYGSTREDRLEESYSLDEIEIVAHHDHARASASREYQVPGPLSCTVANTRLTFHPMTTAEGRPYVDIDGVLVFVYLDPNVGAVRVSIDLDEAASRLVRPDETVPVRVAIGDTVVFDDSETARATEASPCHDIHPISPQG
jgi:hypothetical protein